MKLRIVGCPDKDFKKYLSDSTLFYGELLIPNKRVRDNIKINIRFSDKIPVQAYASIEGYNASRKAREFLVEIHPWIGAKAIFKTMAHEMVHIKQYALGELNDGMSRWHGKPIDSDELDYYEHPWELEAMALETGLFDKYARKEKLWNIFEEIEDPDGPMKKHDIKWK